MKRVISKTLTDVILAIISDAPTMSNFLVKLQSVTMRQNKYAEAKKHLTRGQ